MKPPYYSPEESKFIIKQRLANKTIPQILDMVNKKFWKGKIVRTYRGLEKFLRRNNIIKRSHGLPSKGLLTESFARVIKLYESGVGDQEISRLLKIPLGTVKSRISMYLNNIKYKDKFEEKENNKINKVLAEKVKILSSEVTNLRKQLNKEQALREIIKDTITEAVKATTPIKIKPLNIQYKKQTRKPEIAMIDLSDWHFGAKEQPIDLLNMGQYNWSEAMRRLETMTAGTMECLDIILKTIPLKRIYVNMLGDFCEGELIRPGHGRSIDKTTAEQAFGAGNALIEKFIIPLYRYFNIPMSFYCVNGNHGRGVGGPDDAHRNTNWDFVMYHHIAARLSTISDIDFNISDSTVLVYDVKETPNWRHMLMHGTGIRSWAGTPWYGIDRACMRLQNLFGISISYIHLGHFHSAANIDMPRGEKLISGSAIGITEYSVDALHTGSEAKQSIYGFNNRYGKTWEWQIRLAPLLTPTPNEKGVYTPVSKVEKPILIKKKL